jgi:CDP-glucose 4,6-dehydratase
MILPSPDFWRNKRVFITGHTGFKGSWLCIWLQMLQAKVFGYALEPITKPSLFEQANLADGMFGTIGDINNFEFLLKTLLEAKPDIVIHMAAQPLVRHSYQEPIKTYATNVMGTVHLLEAIRSVDSVKAVVNVTTDKCYENKEWLWGYRENEPMGGQDPYSSSKGCSELITNAYRQSYYQQNGVALASARAGNVIGGGDWSVDRLIPDIIRALDAKTPVLVRNPNAIRPWQHVLEPLSGYLLLAQRLFEESNKYSGAWNFGCNDNDVKPVQWIVEEMSNKWGTSSSWILDDNYNPHEATYLKLDISKAKTLLGWNPTWTIDTAIEKIINWNKLWGIGQHAAEICRQEIRDYTKDKK